MSYSSAASSSANGSKRSTPPVKARIAPSAKPPQNISEPSIDESSYRLGGKLSTTTTNTLVQLLCDIKQKNQMSHGVSKLHLNAMM